MTLGDELVRRFDGLRVWRRSGERAPHKPLLVLLALGRVQQGCERLNAFGLIEQDLKRLLIDFGPPRASVHPEYPFWRLQQDGVWEVSSPVVLKPRRGNTDPLKSQLLAAGVKGGFTEEVFGTLQKHPEINRELARHVLHAHFPESLHPAIASAVGVDLDAINRDRKRDTKFREEVISAWGHQCGFCGYDIKLDNSDLGLEAAHIQWVQAGGPDTLHNGISCCSLHHQALDRGAIGLDNDLRILVSSRLHGSGLIKEYFLRLSRVRLTLPARTSAFPSRAFIEWHRAQVFRGEPRD